MNRFPFAVAAQFLTLLNTKVAAEYAPPDVTGELEGKFLAPVQQVTEAIVQLIVNELKTGNAYLFYANTLRDLSHHSIAEEFRDHAVHETEHAEYLMRRLAAIAGTAQLPDIPSPPPVTTPAEIIDTMIRIEQEGIAKWRLLRSMIGDENPMRYQVEGFLVREQEHLDELQLLIPKPEGVPGDPPAPATATPPSAPAPAPAPVDAAKTAAIKLAARRLQERLPASKTASAPLTLKQRIKLAATALDAGGAPPIPPEMMPGSRSDAVSVPPGFMPEPMPEMPPEMGPDMIDPQALEQLAVEEQARDGEAQEAAAYFSEQSKAKDQQIQQMQQQLQQVSQQAQQAEQMRQQEEAAKMQAQQQAQLASSTANTALQQQLEMQGQALQSRQMTTQVLSQHDQLRQQLREVIDPPAPPPMDPAAAAGQQPAQPGAPPAEGAPPPAPAPGQEAMPKVAGPGSDVMLDAALDLATSKKPLFQVGVPAAIAVAGGALSYYTASKGGKERVDAARNMLQGAEAAYAQDRSHVNAVKLLAAKGALGAAEIHNDYPTATALAAAGTSYALGRKAVIGGENIKNMVQRMQAKSVKHNSMLVNPYKKPGA